jgi:hypothetical protein
MKRYLPLSIIAFCLVLIVYLNGLNLFFVDGDSEYETTRSLIASGISLQKNSLDPIVCSDNIREYNVTGYRLMSGEEIQKRADLEGETPYIGVGIPKVGDDDVYITVVRNMALPSNASIGYLGAEGRGYHFHRYFWGIWGYSIESYIIS